jgi:hypothetical protein
MAYCGKMFIKVHEITHACGTLQRFVHSLSVQTGVCLVAFTCEYGHSMLECILQHFWGNGCMFGPGAQQCFTAGYHILCISRDPTGKNPIFHTLPNNQGLLSSGTFGRTCIPFLYSHLYTCVMVSPAVKKI